MCLFTYFTDESRAAFCTRRVSAELPDGGRESARVTRVGRRTQQQSMPVSVRLASVFDDLNAHWHGLLLCASPYAHDSRWLAFSVWKFCLGAFVSNLLSLCVDRGFLHYCLNLLLRVVSLCGACILVSMYYRYSYKLGKIYNTCSFMLRFIICVHIINV